MTQPHWYIIVNPAAGAGAVRKRWPAIERLLQDFGFSYTVQFTRERGHATRLADDGILKGFRYIMGVGGDGTNHEITNGILGQKHAPSTDIHYALLPIGTGNDWARTYGLSRNPAERLQNILKLQTTLQDAGMVRYQSEGRTRERYFVNVAGMAYDAFIARAVDERPRRPNRWQYLLMVGQQLFRYRLRPARIRVDSLDVEDYFYTVNVGICPYSGGGMRLVPHALPNDGLLALTYAGRLSKLEVLLQTPRFYTGTILRHRKVNGLQTAGPIRVDHVGDMPTLVEADGEFLGETPVEFFNVPGCLRVVL